MSREEEKYKAATESWDKQGFKNQGQKIPYKLGFLEGFDYAGQNPRKGLWDANKVIKWLQDNADSYTWYDEFEGESGMTDDFIEDLRKAMEE